MSTRRSVYGYNLLITRDVVCLMNDAIACVHHLFQFHPHQWPFLWSSDGFLFIRFSRSFTKDIWSYWYLTHTIFVIHERCQSQTADVYFNDFFIPFLKKEIAICKMFRWVWMGPSSRGIRWERLKIRLKFLKTGWYRERDKNQYTPTS